MLSVTIRGTIYFFIVSLFSNFHLHASNNEETFKFQMHSSTKVVSEQSGDIDKFSFLSTKYPLLLEESKKPFEPCYEETKHYDKLKSLVLKGRKSPEETLIDGAKDALALNTLHYFGEQQKQFMLDQIKPLVDNLQENHPQNGYFNVFFKRVLENHTFLEDILLPAEYIFQTVKDGGGGKVLFLGRTPCLVQVAYEELLKVEKDKTQIPVHVNFSGHPDALTKRESTFFSSKTNIIRDIVTPEKLDHYFSYLDTKDILKTSDLFIVDILGSGSSLNSFLRVINTYYQSRQTTVPKLSFLNLTQDMNWSVDRSEFFTFKKMGNVSNRGTLTLPEDKAKNLKSFNISVCSIPVFDKVLTEMLDQDMFQEFLVHGVQYPAQKWTSEFDKQRDEGGKHHLKFYDYLRNGFSSLISKHKNSISENKKQ